MWAKKIRLFVEVMTDKAVVEIPAKYQGKVGQTANYQPRGNICTMYILRCLKSV